jgi:hypothetical protein
VTLPPAPGHRVATGKLRVDAARAVDKLRDYQLPEPTMWVLEVVRAAVLAKASRIRIHGDADDVWIAWEGPALDPSDLACLFDDLVDPAPPAERRHLRLLATGVNTALGMSPRWVDLYACAADRTEVVRYTPKLLTRDADGAATGLRTLTARAATAPAGIAPSEGVVVHQRRLPLLSAVPIMIGFGEAPELAVARRACADLEIPITIGGLELSRERSHSDLVRMPLGEGLDGFLAIVDPSFAEDEARIDVAELGVHLTRYTLPLLGIGERRARIPIRLLIDARRMPTNASRSAVRLDEPPMSDAVRRAGELLPQLVARMASELAAASKVSPIQRERLRAAALTLIAAGCAGAGWRTLTREAPRAMGAYGAAIAPLLSIPLVRDALGRPRSLGSFGPAVGIERVHRGVDPVAGDLETWLGDVLWAPSGDASAVLLGAWDPPNSNELVKSAVHARKAHAAWMRGARQEPEVALGPGQLLSVPLRAPGVSLGSAMPPAYFPGPKDLEGELVLFDPRARRDGMVNLRIDGRELEHLWFESDVPVLVVAQSNDLRASPSYRSVERDVAFEKVMSSVRAASIVACEAFASELLGKRKKGARASVRGAADSAETNAALFRAAIGQAARMLAPGDIEDAAGQLRAGARALRTSKSPLLEAKAWPTAWGELLSTREIIDAAGKHRAIGRTSARAPGAPIGVRPVLKLDVREIAVMTALIEPAPIVDYTNAITLRRDLASERHVPSFGAALRIEREFHRAVIVWGVNESSLEVRHFGRIVHRSAETGTNAPCRVIVDDDRIVPDASWSSIVHGHRYPIDAWERALGCTFVDALTGGDAPGLECGAASPSNATLALASLHVLIATSKTHDWLRGERAERLCRVPMVSLLGRPELATLRDVDAQFPEGPIPWVPVSESAAAGEFRAIRARPEQAAAYARLLERPFTDASVGLEAKRKALRREEQLERHRRQPVHPPPVAPFIPVAAHGVISGYAAIGGADAEVRIEGRTFRTEHAPGALPVSIIVDLAASAIDETFDRLTMEAQNAIERVRVRGARQLLATAAQQHPEILFHPPWLGLIAVWTRRGLTAAADEELRQQIVRARGWKTVQGEHVALEEAERARAIHVADWHDPWLGPEGGRPSEHDLPILQLSSDRARQEIERDVLEALSLLPARDLTSAIVRLQSERRIARGLVAPPRIPNVKDDRFRFVLSDLLAGVPGALEVLGFGEAAFTDEPMSRIYLFRAGVSLRTIEVNVVPHIALAVESPIATDHSPSDAVIGKLHGALRETLAQAMRWLIDRFPKDQLPDWLKNELRQSALFGGPAHFEGLAEVPLFETTTGAWVTPSAVIEQRASLGDVWWTDERGAGAPLDPARFALRLTSAEALHMTAWIKPKYAKSDLALDALARANRDRAPVASLAPSDEERSVAWSVVELDDLGGTGARGWAVLLAPGSGARRGMHLHRDMRPLGTVPDPCSWPCLVRVDNPLLTPDRTWSAPIKNGTFAQLQARVRFAIDRELARLVPFEPYKDGPVRVRTADAGEVYVRDDVPLEGVVWSELDEAKRALVVRTPGGETVWRDVGPIAGRLHIDASIHADQRFAIARALYERSIARVVSDLGNRPKSDDTRLPILLDAIPRGHPELLPEVWLPCFAPGPVLLADVLARGARFPVAPADDLDAAIAALGPEVRVLVLGSPIADRVRALAPSAFVPWRASLRAAILSTPPPPPAAPAVAPPVAKLAPEPRPLEKMLLARLLSIGAFGIELRVAPRRKKPLVTTSGGTIELAGRHPVTIAAENAIELRNPTLESILDLITARIAGHLRRTSTYFAQKSEADVAIELLRS